jgi:hypothetical protein
MTEHEISTLPQRLDHLEREVQRKQRQHRLR